MKKTILLLLSLMLFLAAEAQTITAEEARNDAASFFAKRGKRLSASAKPAPTGSTAEESGNSPYYVFNADGGTGYVIISGDGRTKKVLAYSDDGPFNESDMTESMKSWMQGYADIIGGIQENGTATEVSMAKGMTTLPSATVRQPVEKLMSSKWDQRAPYNQKCPMYKDNNDNSYQSLTGCVATAIAQVMRHYEYPKQIKSDLPYTWFDWTSFKTVTLDKVPAGTVINWNDMADVTTPASSEETRDAVASLMLYVGQAVKMSYGATSGVVFDTRISKAMRDYFGYDEGTCIASRKDYSESQWIDVIYKDIAEGHPVTMAGSSSGGRHCFVLDGFDGDEYFHVNWGWGGNNDGYFLVSSLNPYDNTGAGAGTGTDGYSMNETVLLGMKPAGGDTACEESTRLDIYNISVSGSTVKCTFANQTENTNAYDLGMAYIAEDGTLVQAGDKVTATIKTSSSTTKSFSLSLPAGTYRIVPVSKPESSDQWRTVLDPETHYIKAVVSDKGDITMTIINKAASLSVKSIDIKGNLTKGYKQDVEITMSNNSGEFYGFLYLIVESSVQSNDISVNTQLVVNELKDVTKSLSFIPSEAGTYTLYISTSSSKSDAITKKTVTVGTAGAASLSAKNVVVTEAIAGGDLGNYIKGYVTLHNLGTNLFRSKVQAILWAQKTGTSSFYSTSKLTKDVTVAGEGDSDIDFCFDDLNPDLTYSIGVAYTDRSGYIKQIDSAILLTTPKVMMFNDKGEMLRKSLMNIITPEDVVVVDMRNASKILSVKPNSNPNTLYILPEGKSIPTSIEGRNVVTGTKAESITIDIDFPFMCPVAITAKKASLQKTFNDISKRWISMNIPFTPESVTIDGVALSWRQSTGTASRKVRVKEFGYVSASHEPAFTFADDLQPNTPYLLSSVDSDGGSMKGSTVIFSASDATFSPATGGSIMRGSDTYCYYGTTTKESKNDVYVLNADGTSFNRKAESEIEAFGSYFVCKMKESLMPSKIVIEDISTGIEEAASAPDDTIVTIYTLSGMAVGKAEVHTGKLFLPNLPQGIYIVNKKKIIVK